MQPMGLNIDLPIITPAKHATKRKEWEENEEAHEISEKWDRALFLFCEILKPDVSSDLYCYILPMSTCHSVPLNSFLKGLTTKTQLL